MSTKSALPTITKTTFDAVKSDLRSDLKKWWEDESESFDAAVAGTASVWGGMPEIDSKAVVKASPIIRKFVGGELDPRMIRKGGYSSFDDLVNDLLPKLREACPSALTARHAPTATTMEAINVRRS
jgi:hypothetical protein